MLKNLMSQLAPELDSHEYPRRWQDYIGQDNAKRMLQVSARSAKIRKTALEHVFISHGSPGIGKTALAALIAAEMGTTCRLVSGALTVDTARLVFSEMKDGDVLVYDEFHRVMEGGKAKAEWLLHYLQDGTLMGPLGPERQPKVTIVAATTDAGKIPDTIVSRFPLVPPMEEYGDEDAAKIAQVLAKRVLDGLPKLGRADALLIAAAGANNPRAMRRLLVVLRDMTITDELTMKGSRYDIPSLLSWQGITPDGLDPVAQRYLTILATEFQGKAGEKAMVDRLQQPGGLDSVERVLMHKGLMVKTNTGRVLTQAGISRVRALVA